MHKRKTLSSDSENYPPGSLMGRLKERKIIETLAAFAGSGIVIIELAHHILVNHYHFPHQTVDIFLVTIVGALLASVIWRWFKGAEKRPGNVRVEVLIVPLIVLFTVAVDVKLIFIMLKIPLNTLIIGLIFLCFGIFWIIFKSLQWASQIPLSEKKEETLTPLDESRNEKPGLSLELKASSAISPGDVVSSKARQDDFSDDMTQEIKTRTSILQNPDAKPRSSSAAHKDSPKDFKDKKAIEPKTKPLTVFSQLDKSIAVLPFANTCADPEQEYFCGGMMDEIITKFSSLKDWRVIGRTTMLQYKDTNKNYREIGRELGVAAILEGSVRKDKDTMRITSNLINVEDSSVLWSDIYNFKVESVFEIQNDIALKITQALNAKLDKTEKKQLWEKPTKNLDAYNLVLLARQHCSKAKFRKSIDYYEQAIKMDPRYAEAHAGLAEAWFYLGSGYWGVRPSEAYPNTREAAARSMEINPELPGAVAVYGFNEFWHHLDWKTGVSMLKKAIDLDPSAPVPHLWLAGVRQCAADFQEATAEINRGISFDPANLVLHANAALILYQAGKYERSVEKHKMLKQLDPASPYWAQIGLPLARLGRTREALAAFHEGARVSGRASLQLLWLAYGYALEGGEAKSREILSELEERESQEYVFPLGFAYALTTLGDVDGAVSRLQQAFEDRAGLLFLRDPVFFDLHKDRRFSDLLQHLSPAQEI